MGIQNKKETYPQHLLRHIENKKEKVMGEFTFPEFRRRISRSTGWSLTGSDGNSLCESSALDEVNQVVEKLGGVKSIEQSYCNQEISQNNDVNNPNQRPRGGFLSSTGLFSSLGKSQFNPRCASISETVASKEFTGDVNLSKEFGKSAPGK